ncbi:MAG: 3-oxoacyl-[acyl-carrier-protein] reductase [Acidobacteria bacterium]|nr:MAG: 3-oxoacyl-[acyl-carrier-protein] reductase [Acidobacteriota bacterium]
MLKHQVALVTGGSQGIGKAISEKLLAAGVIVAIAALDDQALKDASAEFQSKGLRFKSYGADLAEELQIDSLVKSVIRDLGPVDILINNAGITGPTLSAHEITTNDWDRTLAINLRTPFLLSRAIVPSMIQRKNGIIINISSIAGKMAYPLRSPYAASKWGLIGLTLTQAQELGPYNIRVNAICPGPTRTEMIDSVIRARAKAAGVDERTMLQEYTRATALKRMVLPDEVADLVLFLCSPESGAITGQAIDVSAGYGFRIGN